MKLTPLFDISPSTIAIIPIALLIGCATLAGCATAPPSNREEIALNKYFDDRVAAESEAELIEYIEMMRGLALEQLAKISGGQTRICTGVTEVCPSASQ